MIIEIDFHDAGPARSVSRSEFWDVMYQAIRWTAKGIAITYGYKISFKRT